MKEEALKLADLMIDVTDCETSEFYRAGQMIRRLVDRIDELEKYEQQIKDLQLQVAQVQASAALMKKDDEKEGRKKVAEKIAKKYNGEKFIMVKPEDLIRFIEEG